MEGAAWKGSEEPGNVVCPLFLSLSADGGSGGEEVRRNQVDVVSHEDIGTKNVVCPLFRYFAAGDVTDGHRGGLT